MIFKSAFTESRQSFKALTFKKHQIKKIYKIFHNVNCTRSYVIHLMVCIFCDKQYVRKAETRFNLRLNNHVKMWKYVKKSWHKIHTIFHDRLLI